MAIDNTVFQVCTAPTELDLVRTIQQRTRELTEQYEEVWIQSVSHDVLNTGTGAWIWSALITCEVQGVKDAQEGADHEG